MASPQSNASVHSHDEKHNEFEELINEVNDFEQEAEEKARKENDQDQERKDEESEDEVQFVGNGDTRKSDHEITESEEKKEEDDVVIVETCAALNGQITPNDRSRANTNAVMAANGYVTPATLEAELQCIICQSTMFKPVSASCGHSFCRVCLMDSFLTRSMEETQCPICRVDILRLYSTKRSLTSFFSVNITLWNLVQLLIPSIATRKAVYQKEEEQEFKRKLDQLDAKWKVHHLNEQAATYHGDHDERETGPSVRWQEEQREYPVLKVEDTHDGNLHVSRNIVLDTSDENEDGYMNMRVGIAIVEFPSIFELYNEHQECSVNVIKMEEDEEMTDGLPFFMNEDGDDDALVCSSYYNEIGLRVCDEAGNCVMERTRGAHGGIVTFPGMRLDVPGGLYSFHFSDDLYGLKLSITTRLREPHEISDTPVADYVSLIHDEARDGSRRHRRRNDENDSEGEYDESGNESNDSFIVDDLNDDVLNEQPVGRFSDDDDEGEWHFKSDDEANNEEREQRRSRRNLSGRRCNRNVRIVNEQEDEVSSEDNGAESINLKERVEGQESEDEDDVRPDRRNVRVVDDAAFSSDNDLASPGGDSVERGDNEDVLLKKINFVRRRSRNTNQIVDSDDEDECRLVGNEEERKNCVDAQGFDKREKYEGEEVDGEDEAVSFNENRRGKRKERVKSDESDEENTPCPRMSFDGKDDGRFRKRARQGRLITEDESDEEKMERSILAGNSDYADEHNADHDEDASDSHFRRVYQCDEEENDQDESDEALADENEAPDYLEEGEDNYFDE